MKRFACLEHLSRLITDELVVVGMTGIHWEWSHLLPDYEGNMKICSMGNATALGTGMALALPQRAVVVLDSDGSSLLDIPTLTTIGTYQPPNLRVFVFDNEVYSGSRISEPSATAYATDLEAMASAAGIASATTVRDVDAFVEATGKSFASPGPSYVVAKVDEDLAARKLPKPTRDYLEYKYRFVRYVERTENKTIFSTLR